MGLRSDRWCSELAALAVAGHDLDLVHLDELVDLAELHIVEHEGPDIIAEAVCVQFSSLEGYAGLDPLVEGIVDALVELQQHLESQSGCDLTVLQYGIGENYNTFCLDSHIVCA